MLAVWEWNHCKSDGVFNLLTQFEYVGIRVRCADIAASDMRREMVAYQDGIRCNVEREYALDQGAETERQDI